MDNSNYGMKLKEARRKKGLSQERLAELLQCDRSKISRIENAESPCLDFIFLRNLAENLCLSVDDLLDLPTEIKRDHNRIVLGKIRESLSSIDSELKRLFL